MTDYLEPIEIKEIESIVTKYLHAYQHVPYRTELRQFDHDRPGVQVMEVRINQSIINKGMCCLVYIIDCVTFVNDRCLVR